MEYIKGDKNKMTITNKIYIQNQILNNFIEKLNTLEIESNSGKSFLNKAVENIEEAIKENNAFLEIKLKEVKK
jgi:hypothetical protein